MTSIHPLDADTTLELVAPGLYRGRTSKFYSNFSGPFGGFTAACLLRSVLDHPKRQDVPIALTVNYCAAISEGAFEISVREVRSGKSTQHWLVELVQASVTAATASVVCGAHRAVWSHHPGVMPAVEPPEEIPIFEGFRPSGWLSQYEMRFSAGAPDFSAREVSELRPVYSKLWLKDKPERKLDYLALACMSDAFIIRAFMARGKFVPVGTVTLTTYFHGNADAMQAQGAQPLLCTADAQVFNDGFADQTAQLWGAGGRLLATSNQIVWYKE
jgi:acyl-CoA thioesterase